MAAANGHASFLDDLRAAIGGLVARDRAAIVVVYPADSNEVWTADEIDLVRMAGVPVYTISLTGSRVAGVTGVVQLSGVTPADLPKVVERIAIELQNQYVVGYFPPPANAGGFRKVEVQLNAPRGLPPLTARTSTASYTTAR